MSSLRFSLFGTMQVTHDNCKGEPIKIRPQAMVLLAYLLLYRNRSHRRDMLAGLFWGDMDEKHAKRCLNTAIWRLRRRLKVDDHPECSILDTFTPGEIKFNQKADCWLDVDIFESKIMSGLAKQDSELEIQNLEEAHQLYVGDLLEGFYDDWVLRERERLRELYLKSLASLMKFHQLDGNLEKSLICGQCILDMDPLREEICRSMMRMYVSNGQRNLAIQQYKNCCENLEAELDIPPMLETQVLYQEILLSDSSHLQSILPASEDTIINYRQALDELKLAIKKMEMAQMDVHHVVEMLSVLKDTDARIPDS